MQQLTYYFSFEEVSAAEAGVFAQELRNQILDTSPDISVTRVRENRHTQDAGTILQIILGASSVVTLASALGNWLILHRKASITIKRDGELVAQNITSKDAVRLTEIMCQQFTQQKRSATRDDDN